MGMSADPSQMSMVAMTRPMMMLIADGEVSCRRPAAQKTKQTAALSRVAMVNTESDAA